MEWWPECQIAETINKNLEDKQKLVRHYTLWKNNNKLKRYKPGLVVRKGKKKKKKLD